MYEWPEMFGWPDLDDQGHGIFYARELQVADEESLDQLLEELENEVVAGEEEGEWEVWLEEGCRPVPNG